MKNPKYTEQIRKEKSALIAFGLLILALIFGTEGFLYYNDHRINKESAYAHMYDDVETNNSRP